jgi:hypothetical protein
VEKQRRGKAQKAENVMHLVCWDSTSCVLAVLFLVGHHEFEQSQRDVSV